MSPSSRFVFFDLDDTLLDHRAAERAALADVHAAHDLHLGRHAFAHVHQTYHDVNSALWADFGAGRVSSADLKRLRMERLLGTLGATDLDAAVFSDAYLDRYAAHWAWRDGARDAYLATADRRPVGLLTNGFSAQQRAKLARFPELAERASAVVISDEIGVAKPAVAVFEHARVAASRAVGEAFAPGEMLLVGDSLSSDIRGAVGAGWRAVWLGGDAAQAPDGVPCVAHCADLAAVLSA